MAAVDIDSVTVHKESTEILRAITLEVADGSVLAVLGQTGSGKSTLLRAIAGLDPLTSGRIRFDGVDVTHVETAARDIAFAFQKPALLPHRSARRNIAMPLELRGDPAGEIRDRVGAEARAMHIDGLLNRRPDQLSLGEAHAVQMARSLIKQPRVLLLDEPFASIDPEWRTVLRRELMIIQRGFDVTTVIALNDPADAMRIADRIAVLEDGAILQVGTPDEVSRRPRTISVAMLSGDAEVLPVSIEVDGDGSWLRGSGFRVRAWQPELRAHDGRRFDMVVRPEWWELDPNGTIEGTVERITALFDGRTLICRVGTHQVSVRSSRVEAADLAEGDRVRLRLKHYRLIDPTNGIALALT